MAKRPSPLHDALVARERATALAAPHCAAPAETSTTLPEFLAVFWHPGAWMGGIEAKPGMFFTPHPVPRVEQMHFESHVLLRSVRPTAPPDNGMCSVLFTEGDLAPPEVQLARLRTSGLPPPTAAVYSGGRSVHAFWRLAEPVPFWRWLQVQAGILELLGGDVCCAKPCQPMRVGGAAGQPCWLFDPSARPSISDFALVEPFIAAGLARIAEGGSTSDDC